MPSARAICLVCSPRASSADDLAPRARSVRPAVRAAARAVRPPRARRRRRPASSRPALDLSAEHLGGLRRRERRAVRSWLGHRVVGVGGGEHPRRRSQRSAPTRRGGSRCRRGARGAQVATGASAARNGERRRTRSVWYACSLTRSHSSGVSGAGFCQIRVGDRDPPDVVDERGSPHGDHVRGRPAGIAAPPPSPARPRPRSGRPGTARRGRRSRPSPRAPGRSPRPAASAEARARRRASSSHGDAVVVEREDLVGVVGEQRGDRRVERAPGSLADDARGDAPSPPSMRWNAASRATWTMRNGERDLVAREPARLALAVPALGEVDEERPARTRAGRAGRVSICATSHIAADVRAMSSRPLGGSSRDRVTARDGGAGPGSASARTMPAIVCGRRAEHHRGEVLAAARPRRRARPRSPRPRCSRRRTAGTRSTSATRSRRRRPAARPSRIATSVLCRPCSNGKPHAEVRRQAQRRDHLGRADLVAARR